MQCFELNIHWGKKNNIPGSFDIFGSYAVKVGRIAAYHAMKHLFWKKVVKKNS